MGLIQYDGKTVKINDRENLVYLGRVLDYIFPEDNETNEESIILEADDGTLLEFYEKDIQQIEIISL